MLDFRDNHGNFGHIFGNNFHDAVEEDKFKLNPHGTFHHVKGILGMLLSLCSLGLIFCWWLFKIIIRFAFWIIMAGIRVAFHIISFFTGRAIQNHDLIHDMKRASYKPNNTNYIQQRFTQNDNMPNQYNQPQHSQQNVNNDNYRNEEKQLYSNTHHSDNNGSNDDFTDDLK